jgi:HJR/Mrr/RecB family endonuclease
MKVFISHASRDREFVAILVRLLQDEGYEVFEPGRETPGDIILSEISAAVHSADVMIAVVTASNPNVFYELGMAAGAGVPILIAAPPGEAFPGNLASVPYVQLSGDGLRDAQTIARRAKELQGAPSVKLKHFESAEAALRAAARDPDVMESLSPSDFEQLVKELFEQRGYTIEPKGAARDTEVDFAFESQNEKKRVLVEVKKLSRQSRVSVEAVRKFVSAVSTANAPLGILVAASGYTAAASAFAAGTSILLRTLEEILAAKSEKDMLSPNAPAAAEGSASEESLETLLAESRDRLGLLETNLPRRVDPMAVSPTAKLPFKALSYREALIWRMAELSRTALDSFMSDKLASAILLTRAAIETTAALWYLCAKVDAALTAGAVGDIDAYLMRLIMGSKTDPEMPQALNVLTFVDYANKDIEGFRHQYDILSEFAHTNWAGTTGLYSKVDVKSFWTDFGSDVRDNEGPRRIGVINLSVALGMFQRSYNRLADILPAFIALCESELNAGGR